MLITGVLTILIAVLVLLAGFKAITDYSSFFFWLSFVLYFDPGGIFSGINDGSLFGRVKYYDVMFVLMMISWRLSGIWKYKAKLKDNDFQMVRITLLVYLIYFIIVYGYWIPNLNGYPDFPLFLQKSRQIFYSFLVFIALYQFTLYSFETLRRPLLVVSLLTLTAFFITVITGIELLPLLKWTRYEEDDRISMFSYGLAYYLLPMGFISYGLKNIRKEQWVKWLYICMFLMIMAIALTLTRREFLRIGFMLLVIPLLVRYIANVPLFYNYRRLLVTGSILVVLAFVVFPYYSGLVLQLLADMYTLFTGGEVSGETDYRVNGEGDLLFVKKLISENALMGIGYYPAPWDKINELKRGGNIMGLALDASNEVALFGSYLRLGLVGILLPILIHLKMLLVALGGATSLRKSLVKTRNKFFEVITIIMLIYYFITLFTIGFFNLFLEYYHPPAFAIFSSFSALLLALLHRQRILLHSLPGQPMEIPAPTK